MALGLTNDRRDDLLLIEDKAMVRKWMDETKYDTPLDQSTTVEQFQQDQDRLQNISYDLLSENPSQEGQQCVLISFRNGAIKNSTACVSDAKLYDYGKFPRVARQHMVKKVLKMAIGNGIKKMSTSLVDRKTGEILDRDFQLCNFDYNKHIIQIDVWYHKKHRALPKERMMKDASDVELDNTVYYHRQRRDRELDELARFLEDLENSM